jgi:chromosome segregation ATPase
MLLEKQNKKYENEIDEKTNKYYEDKKKWQLKIKEIEEKYQRLSSLSSSSSSSATTSSSSPANNSDHFSQYISDLRNQLSSVTDMLIETLAENEQLLQHKISLEKKNVLLETETKSLQAYLQSYQPSSASAVSSSSSSSSSQQEKNDS